MRGHFCLHSTTGGERSRQTKTNRRKPGGILVDTRRIVLNRQSIEARHAYLQAQHAYLEAVSPDRHRSAAELMGCAQVVLTRLMFYEDRLRTLLRHLRSSA